MLLQVASIPDCVHFTPQVHSFHPRQSLPLFSPSPLHPPFKYLTTGNRYIERNEMITSKGGKILSVERLLCSSLSSSWTSTRCAVESKSLLSLPTRHFTF